MDIFEAIRSDNLSYVRRFLLQIDEPNEIKDEEGLSLIRSAIVHGASMEMISFLVSADCDIYEMSKEGVSLVDDSIERNRLDVLSLLHKKGLDIVGTKRDSGLTPIMLASCFGRLEIAQYLLKHGAQTSNKDSYGKSAKDYAKSTRHMKILQLLEENA